MEYNGIINLYKEQGLSSFQVTYKLRKILGVKKAGHTGTLDPLAEGVLPICLGKSTRTASYIMENSKEYLATLYLGFETDTYDLEGKILNKAEKLEIEDADIIECTKSFIGEIDQVPPIYSAIKVNGKKLYEYARNNEKVEIKSRKINIQDIKVNSIEKDVYEGIDVIKVKLLINCSKGTYIRSICKDIGDKLGVYGVMAHLIRTKSGKFNIENSYTFNQIEEIHKEGKIQEIVEKPIDYMNLEVISLKDKELENYLKGVKFICEYSPNEYIVKDNDENLIGIGLVNENNEMKSKKRL